MATSTPISNRLAAASRSPALLGYRPQLDGIRAIAITLVVVHHAAAFLMPSHEAHVLPGGFLGVDLFLVLSGFLITTLLMERREREARPIRTFYLRRVLRLVPAVAALLAANLLYALVRGVGVADALRSVVVVPLYVTNWAELAGISISPYVTHLWSLGIEEQFYLVWPVLLFGGLRVWGSRRKLVVMALTIGVLAAVWRAALYARGDPWLRIYLRTDARADALAIGAALAFVPRTWFSAALGSRARSLVGAGALAVILAAAELLQPSDPALYRGGFTVIAVAAAVLLACSLDPDSALSRSLARPPLVLLGRLSYSLYLWHFGIFQIVAAHTPTWPAAIRVPVGIGLALLAASASYWLVERPALRLKRRLGRPASAGA